MKIRTLAVLGAVLALSSTAVPAGAGGRAAAKAPAPRELRVDLAEPATDSSKTVAARVGDTVAIVVPEWAGTEWLVATDVALGKPRQSLIVGYKSPSASGLKSAWKVQSSAVGKHTVRLVNRSLGGADMPTIEVAVAVNVE